MTSQNRPNLERQTSRSASARPVRRSRFGLNSKRAHPPIPPLRVRRQFAATRELEARALQVPRFRFERNRYFPAENAGRVRGNRSQPGLTFFRVAEFSGRRPGSPPTPPVGSWATRGIRGVGRYG
mgnify:CR=1 FL=1